MSKARVRLPPEMDELLSSDLERIIHEANLGTEDTIIATRYLVEIIPQEDIAAELDLNRSTVSKRIAKILIRMDKTARKLKIYKSTESKRESHTDK